MSLFKILSHLLPVGSVENHENFIQGIRSPDSSMNEGLPVQDVGKLSTCVCVCVCVCVCFPQTGKCRLSLFQQVLPIRKHCSCVPSLRHLFNPEVHCRFIICSVILQPASSANARVILTERTNPSTPNTVILGAFLVDLREKNSNNNRSGVKNSSNSFREILTWK